MYTILGHLVLIYFLQLLTVQSEMALSIQWAFLNENKVVRQTLDRQTLDTTNPGQTNDGHNKRRT